MIERYTRPEMGEVWSLENRFQKMLEVEKAVAFVQGQQNIIPQKAAQDIQKRARFSLKRIQKIEERTRHDVVAFVQNVSESLGASGRYVHYGLTSSDVLDTAFSLQVKEAKKVLHKAVGAFQKNLLFQIRKHKGTLCAGRTHGMHAEPTTFGYKLSGYYMELQRNKERLEKAFRQMAVGKLSGAVGSYSFMTPEMERKICRRLKLNTEDIATQVIPRDRHCEMLGALCFIGLMLERLALELRHLQRTEVAEAFEGFSKGQTGSSAMPHKKNPISAENISGLARLLKSYFIASQDNVTLWHERDISHSSVERVSFPDAFILCDYALARMSEVLSCLQVKPLRMKQNMELSRGQIFTSHLLISLIKKGLSRKEAYELLQSLSHDLKEGEHLRDRLLKHKKTQKILTKKQWDHLFSGEPYKKNIEKMIQKKGVMWTLGKLLYEGKAKLVYEIKESNEYVGLKFKDTLTAFNGAKEGSFHQKGLMARDISSVLFKILNQKEILTHWVCDMTPQSMVVQSLEMIPLEVVIRNILAGSTARKFHKQEGEVLKAPLLELYYKDDFLGDPFINVEQALWLKTVNSVKDIEKIKDISYRANKEFISTFSSIGIDVVDFKLEFGYKKGQLVLADELSPDNFRLWDKKTGDKLDKDRFRKDLGSVQRGYKEVLNRMRRCDL